MHLHLGGHLSWYLPNKASDIEIDLTGPVELRSILEQLHLPAGEVSIIAINGVAASIDGTLVTQDDRVELYPPIGGG